MQQRSGPAKDRGEADFQRIALPAPVKKLLNPGTEDLVKHLFIATVEQTIGHYRIDSFRLFYYGEMLPVLTTNLTDIPFTKAGGMKIPIVWCYTRSEKLQTAIVIITGGQITPNLSIESPLAYGKDTAGFLCSRTVVSIPVGTIRYFILTCAE